MLPFASVEQVRPVIGLTTYRETATWGTWRSPADLLPTSYVDALASVGAIPVMLPPAGEPDAAVASLLGRLDGLLLTGGPDVDPARYSAPAHPLTQRPQVERDHSEFALIHAAIDQHLPVLAICRGLQVLNVALGGSLVQHVPDISTDYPHTGGSDEFAEIEVRLERDSWLGRTLGGHTSAWCHHHQSIDRLGTGLRCVGTAPDGVVEAVELITSPVPVVGIQSHPEESDDRRVFAEFVSQCPVRAGMLL
jgi:putative glutamine amidotransferase